MGLLRLSHSEGESSGSGQRVYTVKSETTGDEISGEACLPLGTDAALIGKREEENPRHLLGTQLCEPWVPQSSSSSFLLEGDLLIWLVRFQNAEGAMFPSG